MVLSLFWLGCQSEAPEPQSYLTATSIDALSAETIRDYWGQNPEATPFISYDVEVVRITFMSEDLRGQAVESSGALLIPKGVTNPRVISLQHATFFADEEAPSENGSFSVVSRKSIFAAHGSIVLLPDYLGYGTTKGEVHPYHHAGSLSRQSLDMLNASLAYLKERGINHQPGITLAGYSEGAYASLALAQRIETEQPSLKISGISLGSGGHNLLESFNYFYTQLDSPTGCLPCNAFLIYSYWHIAGRDRPLSDYFQEPHASQIQNGLLDGGFNSQQIAESMPTTMRNLFTQSFLERVANGEESELLGLLAENSLHEHFPSSPMLITHGTADTVAPFFNSEQYAAGAENSSHEVQFMPLDNIDHFEGIFHWGIHTMNWLNE